MKCDEALSDLATGGPFRRWRASRHRARCPACSAKTEALRAIVAALSEVPPLAASDRRAWMRAADAPSPARPRAPIARRVALAAWVLGLLAFGAWRTSRPVLLSTPAVVAAVDPGLIKQTTLRELDGLQAQASALSRELDDLLREVDLLDARRDVEALQLRFASTGGRGGP